MQSRISQKNRGRGAPRREVAKLHLQAHFEHDKPKRFNDFVFAFVPLLPGLFQVRFPCKISCLLLTFHSSSRYLQQWILEGTLSDPHDEFFVKPNFKYISTRGRTFWTRSYIIQEETVPEFLSNIKNDILSCGKAMSLLRMSVPGVSAIFLALPTNLFPPFCCSRRCNCI